MARFTVIALSLLVLFLFDDNLCEVETLEPISTSIAVGTAIVSACYSAVRIKCRIYECCEPDWVNLNVTGLTEDLKTNLHGQHLVLNTVADTIKDHMTSSKATKALVLSFHGWTGSGKNFVSNIIAKNIYQKGERSAFYHLFVPTLHFPHASEIDTYKNDLRQWIRGNVSLCAQSMFVFDGMEHMPSELIDVIQSFLDDYPVIDGIDYRKSIFILLSNSAGDQLTGRTLDYWIAAKKREAITLQEMKKIIIDRASNTIGDVWYRSLLKKNLITAFIPFLPLERQHIKQCIMDDLIRKGLLDYIIDKIADQLSYFPKNLNLYSTSGCKRVSQFVDYILQDI